MNYPTVAAPPNRKELSDQTEFGTAAIAAGAFSGAAVGTVIPVFGTLTGATIGAGVGFILGIFAKEKNDSKRAGYEQLLTSDDGKDDGSDDESTS